ncbi:MAG: peroxiredoxin [Tissierellia bacterium]|nr:peroxiredoxin [Tissierellia bacterium]
MINKSDSNNGMQSSDCITIGRIAPDFTALSTQGVITLSQYRGKWVLLFSQPGDFASVATTELISFAQMYPEFVKRNVELLGITIDNNYSDIGWVLDIYNTTGIMIPFPILEDRNAEVVRKYGMVNPDNIYESSVRDAFIISPSQVIMAIITYPVSCGRNTYELLRVIDSLQVTSKYNAYTPANWTPGNPVIVPTPHNVNDAMIRFNEQEKLGLQCSNWYTCFSNINNIKETQ